MYEWFERWFDSEDYLLVYDHRNEDDAVELNRLIISETNLPDGANILDAACGAGRHSILFAREGYNVTGFDLSENLLNIAGEKARQEKLNIRFIKEDMRTFVPDASFDLITNLFTSFGYFSTDDENFTFVKNAYSRLNDSGFYVFDYFNCNYLQNNLVPNSKREIDGVLITENRKIKKGRVEKDIIISQGEFKNVFHESVKLYSFEKIVESFQKIGYKLDKVFGNYKGEKFEPVHSPRMIAFFKK